jgi:hypothetical protein
MNKDVAMKGPAREVLMYALILGSLDLLEWIRHGVPIVMTAYSRRLYDRSLRHQDSQQAQ